MLASDNPELDTKILAWMNESAIDAGLEGKLHEYLAPMREKSKRIESALEAEDFDRWAEAMGEDPNSWLTKSHWYRTLGLKRRRCDRHNLVGM